MQPRKPNEYGVFEPELREIVARHHRGAFAALKIALCEDGQFRYGLEIRYSHGGLGSPITIGAAAYPTIEAVRAAGLEQLLHSLHEPFPSDPDRVRTELAELRRQIEERLRQPSLF